MTTEVLTTQRVDAEVLTTEVLTNKDSSAAEVLTTHIDDVLGCGGPAVSCLVRKNAKRRCGELGARGKNFPA